MEYGRSITDACIDFEETKNLLTALSDAVKERRKLSKFFKFEKEVAHKNIGLVKSILYQFIKEQKEKINLNETVEEFSFLSQDETVCYFGSIRQRSY